MGCWGGALLRGRCLEDLCQGGSFRRLAGPRPACLLAPRAHDPAGARPPLAQSQVPLVAQKRLEALRREMPSDVDVSIDPSVSLLDRVLAQPAACMMPAPLIPRAPTHSPHSLALKHTSSLVTHSQQELEGLDDAALKDLYEMRVAEQRAAAGREDFSGTPPRRRRRTCVRRCWPPALSLPAALPSPARLVRLLTCARTRPPSTPAQTWWPPRPPSRSARRRRRAARTQRMPSAINFDSLAQWTAQWLVQAGLCSSARGAGCGTSDAPLRCAACCACLPALH